MPAYTFRGCSHNTVDSRCQNRANRWLRYRQTEWAGIIMLASVNPPIPDRTEPIVPIIRAISSPRSFSRGLFIVAPDNPPPPQSRQLTALHHFRISHISVSLDCTLQLRFGSNVGSNVTVMLPPR